MSLSPRSDSTAYDRDHQNHPTASRPDAPRRSLVLIAVIATAATLFALVSCGGQRHADLEHPPKLDAFAWNSPVATTVANLKRAGWQATESTETGRVELEASRDGDADAEATARSFTGGELPDAPADASITLFSNDDSLKVVRLVRRGNRDTVRAYISDLADDFGVEGAVWESEPRESNSATGNRTTRREQLFETQNAWITMRMSITEAAEAQLSEASISEVELQFFGKSTNEGLSQTSLVASLEQE